MQQRISNQDNLCKKRRRVVRGSKTTDRRCSAHRAAQDGSAARAWCDYDGETCDNRRQVVDVVCLH